MRDPMERYHIRPKPLNDLKPVIPKPPSNADPIMDYEIDPENDPLDTWFYYYDV
jgi:hypothetical protein